MLPGTDLPILSRMKTGKTGTKADVEEIRKKGCKMDAGVDA